jgi:hypothetical protein
VQHHKGPPGPQPQCVRLARLPRSAVEGLGQASSSYVLQRTSLAGQTWFQQALLKDAVGTASDIPRAFRRQRRVNSADSMARTGLRWRATGGAQRRKPGGGAGRSGSATRPAAYKVENALETSSRSYEPVADLGSEKERSAFTQWIPRLHLIQSLCYLRHTLKH